MSPKTVAVLVLGDVGRSPRMQYHCLSLAQQADVREVVLVGTRGHKCIAEVEGDAKIRQVLLQPSVTQRLPRRLLLVYAPVKVVEQTLQLLWALMRIPQLDCVLVQNPPCIPTFLVVACVKLARGTRVLIDWHNLGFTILALSFGRPSSSSSSSSRDHWVVCLARVYERILGRWIGDGHLTVTLALKTWLQDEFNLDPTRVTVQYDRPPAAFRRRSQSEQHTIFERLGDLLSGGKGNIFSPSSSETRPALVISSTSWTPDEDFGVLLDALVRLDSHPLAGKRRVICVVTGKGPLLEHYQERIAALQLEHVAIRTLWLEPADYPQLMGCMDVGVCLHTSSSNLDLPMKVVDMFGSGLPVCAIDYPCLSELVHHDVNGYTFSTSAQLADQLADLLLDDKNGPDRMARLRQGVDRFAAQRWDQHWAERTKPALDRLGPRGMAPLFWLAVVLLVPGALFLLANG